MSGCFEVLWAKQNIFAIRNNGGFMVMASDRCLSTKWEPIEVKTQLTGRTSCYDVFLEKIEIEKRCR